MPTLAIRNGAPKVGRELKLRARQNHCQPKLGLVSILPQAEFPRSWCLKTQGSGSKWPCNREQV